MLSLVRPNGFSFVTSSQFLAKPRQKINPLLLQIYPNYSSSRNNFNILRNNFNIVTPIANCTQNGVVFQEKVDKEDDEKYVRVGLQRGEAMMPKHVGISLDGNRRWLNNHGLDLDYRPFFQANMRFAELCLKWGVGTGTSFIYGLGNMNHRTKEANDLILGQFERFLEEELENFMRRGVKVSIVGEKSMLSESCQVAINQVEETTKDNTNLDLMLPICYTSQRDIVEATKKISKKVKEGSVELEDVNEDMIEQHLSLDASRSRVDLFIRTGGELRIGMLLGWQVPHVELYFTDTKAPDFEEDVFLDSLRSFQQRDRKFGK